MFIHVYEMCTFIRSMRVSLIKLIIAQLPLSIDRNNTYNKMVLSTSFINFKRALLSTSNNGGGWISIPTKSRLHFLKINGLFCQECNRNVSFSYAICFPQMLYNHILMHRGTSNHEKKKKKGGRKTIRPLN